jgi:hypothetical protein
MIEAKKEMGELRSGRFVPSAADLKKVFIVDPEKKRDGGRAAYVSLSNKQVLKIKK